MAVLKILTAPHPILKKVSTPVEKMDDSVRKLLKDMYETMLDDGNAAGLAAPQVGINKRIIVLDFSYVDEIKYNKPWFVINPEILKTSKEKVLDAEACMSIPGVAIDIERFAEVTVKYLDENWNEQIVEASGELAKAFQHEIDHLNGIIGLDYLNFVKRDLYLRKSMKRVRN